MENYYYDKNFNIYKKVNNFDYEIVNNIYAFKDINNKPSKQDIYKSVVNNLKK